MQFVSVWVLDREIFDCVVRRRLFVTLEEHDERMLIAIKAAARNHLGVLDYLDSVRVNWPARVVRAQRHLTPHPEAPRVYGVTRPIESRSRSTYATRVWIRSGLQHLRYPELSGLPGPKCS